MCRLLLLAGAMGALSGVARADSFGATISDDPSDFLANVTNLADLDFTNMTVSYDASLRQFTVGATVNGPFGAVPGEGGRYVLGIDTGAGKIQPFAGQPCVTFDQTFIISQNGSVNDPTGNVIAKFTSDPADRDFEFDVVIPLASLKPSLQGVAPQDFGFNFWSQQGAAHANTDFAPNNSMISADGTFFSGQAKVSTGAVPEPASWALMITGIGLAGATLRLRRNTMRQSAFA
jgi:hypothetical protein